MGRGTLGRIMNVIGEPVDECGPIGEQAALGSFIGLRKSGHIACMAAAAAHCCTSTVHIAHRCCTDGYSRRPGAT